MTERSRFFARFNRQIMLPEFGLEGQKKLQRAKVLLIGAGGLASSAAYYLTSAGIGKIGIADDDTIEISNLNRQILHDFDQIGKLKVNSAKQTLQKFNPSIDIEPYPKKVTSSKNLIKIVKGYDVIIDCSDNYPTRFTINEACIAAKKPWIHGAVSGFEGQAMTIIPGKGPCYTCLYPSPSLPTDGDQSPGVVGVSSGIIGIVQATEAIKYILGKGNLLVGRLLFVDLLEMTVSGFIVHRNPDCPACANPGRRNSVDSGK